MGRRAINGSGVRALGVPALRMAFILRLSGAAAASAGIEAAADATAKGTKIAASTIITTGRAIRHATDAEILPEALFPSPDPPMDSNLHGFVKIRIDKLVQHLICVE